MNKLILLVSVIESRLDWKFVKYIFTNLNNKLISSVLPGLSTTLLCGSKLDFNLVLMQICRVLSLRQKSKRFIYRTTNQLLENYSSACSTLFPHPSISIRLFIYFSCCRCFPCHGRIIVDQMIKVFFFAGKRVNSSMIHWLLFWHFERLQFHNQPFAFRFCGRLQPSVIKKAHFWDWKIESNSYASVVALNRLENKQNNRQLSKTDANQGEHSISIRLSLSSFFSTF